MKKITFHWSILLFVTLFAISFLSSCSKDKDNEETTGPIYGVWNVESIKDDNGLIEYGKGAYANVSIKFTLTSSGTYSWITDNTSQGSTYPVNATGTYSYSEASNILKISGKMTVGPFTSNDNRLYSVIKLTATSLILTEDTKVEGVGFTETRCKRIE